MATIPPAAARPRRRPSLDRPIGEPLQLGACAVPGSISVGVAGELRPRRRPTRSERPRTCARVRFRRVEGRLTPSTAMLLVATDEALDVVIVANSQSNDRSCTLFKRIADHWPNPVTAVQVLQWEFLRLGLLHWGVGLAVDDSPRLENALLEKHVTTGSGLVVAEEEDGLAVFVKEVCCRISTLDRLPESRVGPKADCRAPPDREFPSVCSVFCDGLRTQLGCHWLEGLGTQTHSRWPDTKRPVFRLDMERSYPATEIGGALASSGICRHDGRMKILCFAGLFVAFARSGWKKMSRTVRKRESWTQAVETTKATGCARGQLCDFRERCLRRCGGSRRGVGPLQCPR